MRFQLSKIQLFSMSILSLIGIANLTSCNSCSNNNTPIVENDDTWLAKMAIQELFTSLIYQNFDYAESHCNNESKNTVRKLSKFSSYYNSVNFLAIDTCILNKEKTEALCDCIFSVDNGENQLETFKVVKYIDQWLVSYKFDEQHKNFWMYDYSLELVDDAPNHYPTSNQEYDFSHLESYITNVVSKIRIGATTMYEFSKLDTNYNGIENEGKTWFTAENYTQGNQYYFDYNLNNFSIRINEYESDNNSYIYQKLTELLVSIYGTPFNSLKNVDTDYYKFKSFRWFTKSYNEIVQITRYSDFIRINLYSIP